MCFMLSYVDTALKIMLELLVATHDNARNHRQKNVNAEHIFNFAMASSTTHFSCIFAYCSVRSFPSSFDGGKS